MCGIVGYLGGRDAYPVLIKGLHRLEYRGYDSAGIAMVSASGELNLYKSKGKVADLERFASVLPTPVGLPTANPMTSMRTLTTPNPRTWR